MDISKKELLEETGISYGQLYRWKREGLIPEEWFEKRSSFTGQETYFPREEILKRIEMIQQLKDMYSLEDLAKMLNPEAGTQLFNEEVLEKIKELNVDVTACFMDIMERDNFTFVEVVLMCAISKCAEEFQIEATELKNLMQHIASGIKNIDNIDFSIALLQVDETYYTMMVQEKSIHFLDDRIKILKEIHLQDISNTIKLKYQTTF